MKPLLVMALLGLAACGVDGEPLKPSAAATLSVGTGGIDGGAQLGVRKGNVSLGIGF